MSNKNFSVGPSAFYQGIQEDIAKVVASGILEKSHRSEAFSNMSQATMETLRQFLKVPAGYHVFYTSSASEAMEITLRSGIKHKSTHVANGAFAERWEKMAKQIGLETQFFQGEYSERFQIDQIQPESDSEAIFITANETSTGSAFSDLEISILQKNFPDKLLCVDATSCAGGVNLPIRNTDALVFSVQKCFGLPSGLGIGIFSPRFFEKSLDKQADKMDIGTFHSLPEMHKKMDGKYQTSETPPVLQIALLGKVIERITEDIGNLDACTAYSKQKAKILWDFLENHQKLKPFINNPEYYSQTVIVANGSEEDIQNAKEKCTEQGIGLANGYGSTKPNAFRIANFLTHTLDDHQAIIDVLRNL